VGNNVQAHTASQPILQRVARNILPGINGCAANAAIWFGPCVCVCVCVCVCFRRYSPLWAVAFSEEFFCQIFEIFRHFVGLLGRGVGPSQGLCLHGTGQHNTTQHNTTHKDADAHPCLELDSNPLSQFASGQDQRRRQSDTCDRQISHVNVYNYDSLNIKTANKTFEEVGEAVLPRAPWLSAESMWLK
jgi:hypothetical protein